MTVLYSSVSMTRTCSMQRGSAVYPDSESARRERECLPIRDLRDVIALSTGGYDHRTIDTSCRMFGTDS